VGFLRPPAFESHRLVVLASERDLDDEARRLELGVCDRGLRSCIRLRPARAYLLVGRTESFEHLLRALPACLLVESERAVNRSGRSHDHARRRGNERNDPVAHASEAEVEELGVATHR